MRNETEIIKEKVVLLHLNLVRHNTGRTIESKKKLEDRRIFTITNHKPDAEITL